MTKVLLNTALVGLLAISVADVQAWSRKAPPADDKAAGGDKAAAAKPADEAKADDTVVAVVNGKKITKAMLAEDRKMLPEPLQALPLDAIFSNVRDMRVDMELIKAQVESSKVDQDAEAKKAVEMAVERAKQKFWLEREIKKLATDEFVSKKYDEVVANWPKDDEIRVAHILVASEDKAKELIKKIQGGDDFGKLARENSMDGSGKEGGELPFFGKEQMVPEFSEAAFKLKPGAITDKPVKTQFGFHVIKMMERRQRKVPSLPELRQNIVMASTAELGMQVMKKLRDEAKIEKFDINGKPDAAADKKAAAVEAAAPVAAPAEAKKEEAAKEAKAEGDKKAADAGAKKDEVAKEAKSVDAKKEEPKKDDAAAKDAKAAEGDKKTAAKDAKAESKKDEAAKKEAAAH